MMNDVIEKYQNKPKDPVQTVKKSKCSVIKHSNIRIEICFWIMFNIIWFWEYCG